MSMPPYRPFDLARLDDEAAAERREHDSDEVAGFAQEMAEERAERDAFGVRRSRARYHAPPTGTGEGPLR